MAGSAPIAAGQLLAELKRGQLHRFADFASLVDQIPASGAGVYTIWDEQGFLVYVCVAGRNSDGKGLSRRHGQGRSS